MLKLTKRLTFNEVAGIVQRDKETLPLPDRSATFLRSSHEYQSFLGGSLEELERRRILEAREHERDALLRTIASRVSVPHQAAAHELGGPAPSVARGWGLVDDHLSDLDVVAGDTQLFDMAESDALTLQEMIEARMRQGFVERLQHELESLPAYHSPTGEGTPISYHGGVDMETLRELADSDASGSITPPDDPTLKTGPPTPAKVRRARRQPRGRTRRDGREGFSGSAVIRQALGEVAGIGTGAGVEGSSAATASTTVRGTPAVRVKPVERPTSGQKTPQTHRGPGAI